MHLLTEILFVRVYKSPLHSTTIDINKSYCHVCVFVLQLFTTYIHLSALTSKKVVDTYILEKVLFFNPL